ncbi:MAG: 3-deoxy-D-manno-octulosonic acid transferase [Syntrophales bacterium]
MWSLAYNLLLFFAAIFGIPYYGLKMLLTGKYRHSLGPKLGRAPLTAVSSLPGRPRIWVHAVSVGEVTAAAPIIRELYSLLPEACIVLSTSTETGQQMARKLATGASLIYYPLDISCVVKKLLDCVRPDIFVPVETEVWPNFVRLCRKRGTRVVMVNGRISPRSFARYKSTAFFWKDVFGELDEAGMISRADAERIGTLGVESSRIKIMGNAKYDGFAAAASPELRQETAGRLGMDAGAEVLVAGSTHEGEDSVIIDVYRKLLEKRPDFRLVIVPRHVERAAAVAELIDRAGFSDVIRMSRINAGEKRNGERIVLVDVIGELFKLYSLATVVFCGGSLVKKGGQNILEAAAWGKVVFHGPYMDDFRDEVKLLHEAGAAITVSCGEELYAGIDKFLDNPLLLNEKGEAGQRAVAAARGAAACYATLVRDTLLLK